MTPHFPSASLLVVAWVILLLILSGPAAPAATTLYVAPNGSDGWFGTLPAPNAAGTDGPFATLVRARDEVRRIKGEGLPEGGVTVELQAGTYELVEPLALGAEDSGEEGRPIVYRAAEGAEVRLVGGKVLSGFTPVTDSAVLDRLPEEARGNVLQTSLPDQGITDFGELERRGMGEPMHESHLELFFQDRPMTLARWPNDGFVKTVDLPDGQNGVRFTYEGDRPTRWGGEKDIWIFGYWFHDWSDTYMKVMSIDTDQRIVTHREPKHRYGLKAGQRFYFLNVLAELDQPGEWYLDRDSGILYFWPPAPVEEGRPGVSVTSQLLTMEEASYITVRGMILEATRGTAVTIGGGTHSEIVGCTIRNTGNRAASLSGGTENGVIGCDIYDTGDGGIALSGGDRQTLTPAGLFADNNHIHDYSRWCRTYRAAVSVSGVGNRVSHNLMHHGPHNCIQLSGNDHAIEYNEIHSVAYETGDVGAFYMGRDWTARGTVIRHNYFHHIQGPGRIGAMGVYLDDQASGITIFGNVFYRVTRAAFIGGGCDNLVENNVFVDCVPAVHIDARGLGWQKAATDDPRGTLRTRLASVAYDKEPYTKYPNLAGILSDDPGTPKRNRIVRNICFGGKWDDIHSGTRQFQIVEDNLVDEDPKFVDREKLDFRLQEGSPAFALGFKPIPVEEIGLYQDNRRASWPVEHEPIGLPDVAQQPGPVPKTGPPPVLKVARSGAAVMVDGAVEVDEWGGPERAVVIEQNLQGEKVDPKSHAWVLHDGSALLIAFDNLVDESQPLRPGNTWGDDAVEVAICNRAAGKTSPIFAFRGYPSDHWEVTKETGVSDAAVAQAAQGVEYAAEVVGKDRWTAEWRIPFASLAIDTSQHRRFELNLTVRKTAGSQWLMWESTRGNSWFVDRAGIIELQ